MYIFDSVVMIMVYVWYQSQVRDGQQEPLDDESFCQPVNGLNLYM